MTSLPSTIRHFSTVHTLWMQLVAKHRLECADFIIYVNLANCCKDSCTMLSKSWNSLFFLWFKRKNQSILRLKIKKVRGFPSLDTIYFNSVYLKLDLRHNFSLGLPGPWEIGLGWRQYANEVGVAYITAVWRIHFFWKMTRQGSYLLPQT